MWSLCFGSEENQMAPVQVRSNSLDVVGIGNVLSMNSDESAAQLRVNVTSPNGTTQAGLEVLMAENGGLSDLMQRTVAAATDRSKELARGT